MERFVPVLKMRELRLNQDISIRRRAARQQLRNRHGMRKAMATAKPGDDEAILLASFLDFAKQGKENLGRYLDHCGIDADDIQHAGDVRTAVLQHYRLPCGGYDIAAAAHDLLRWSPIARRIKEAKRAK
jgi:hypothetical protein